MGVRHAKVGGRLQLSTRLSAEQTTEIARQRFEIPLSLSRPFATRNGGLRVLTLSSSPGLFESDHNHYDFDLAPGTRLDITEPAFTGLFSMPDGQARQCVQITVGSGAYCRHRPQPAIPYRDSRTSMTTTVRLADSSAKCCLLSVLTSGRKGMDERFAYGHYRALTRIVQQGSEIYHDNLQLEPGRWAMQDFGLMENHHCLGTVVMANLNPTDRKLERARAFFDGARLHAGISRPADGLVVAHIMGEQASRVYEQSLQLIHLLEDDAYRFD